MITPFTANAEQVDTKAHEEYVQVREILRDLTCFRVLMAWRGRFSITRCVETSYHCMALFNKITSVCMTDGLQHHNHIQCMEAGFWGDADPTWAPHLDIISHYQDLSAAFAM